MDVYGSLGAMQPSYGSISGIQQLDPSIADDVLTEFGKRLLVPDATPALGKDTFNFLAVTMEQAAQLGYQTSEATKSAAKYIADLEPGNYTLVNGDDVGTFKSSGGPVVFRVTVTSAANVPVFAGPGSSLAVLSPLAPVETGAKPGETGKKKFSIVTPVIGAGIGLLVGGPVGAAVGAAVGLGVEAVRTAA